MRKTFKISTSIGVLILFMCFVNLLPIYAVTEQDTSSSKKIYVKYEEPSEYGLINEYYVDENGNRIELNLIPEDNGLHKATSLPSKFDLRNVDGKNYMTSAKDQLQTGTCWSHATMSSIESNMIMKGLGDNSTDLSEAHLVWFSQGAVTSHDINDPLYNDGNSRTDYNLKLDAFYKGGTPFDAMMSLASWKGAVLESSTYTISDAETFKKNNQTTFIDDNQRYNSVVHLTNANVFDGTDSTNIKQQLMKTGAMYFSYHAPTESYEQDLYYNENNYSYYQTKFVSSNHAVALVGWDDSYPKENFNIQPDTDGAWICKNSWGTDFGDNGYFYISYCDKSITQACSFEATSLDFYNSIYQYDGFGNAYYWCSKEANVFQAKKDENLSAISFYTGNASVTYEVSIYKLNDDYTSPVDGTLITTLKGTQDFSGYHTINLNDVYSLQKGDYFSIVISFPNGAWIFKDDYCYKENTSYMYTNGEWKSQTDGNVSIKAFTTDGIAINEKNFPDVAFRNYIQKKADKNNNYSLDSDELEKLQEIYLSNGDNVKDCTGIEYLTNLKSITIKDCSLTTPLDLTYNTEVVYLNVANCSLESLIVNSDSMTYLDCQNNNLEELDLTNVSNLTYLNVSNNNISYIDVSNCTNLNKILVEYNPLVCLDLSNNPIVKTLSDTGLIRNLTQMTCNPLEFIGLDTSKITQITGANILDGKIYPTSTTVKYTYQCNDTISADFTLTLPSIKHTYAYVSVDETSHKKECSICGSVLIKSEAHVFDNSCDTSCNKCDYERTITHKYVSKYDSTSHWKECSICGNKIDVTSHKFDNACDTSCNNCDYTRTISHKYVSKYDSTSHWKECSVCGDKIDVTSHKFDNACDTSCNDCDYTRTISHKYISKYDSTSHWKECSVCGDKIDVTSHKFDNACDTSCNDCNYTRTASHNYRLKSNTTTHWQQCTICNNKINITNHTYILNNNSINHWEECSVCGIRKNVTSHKFDNTCDTSCNNCDYTRTISHKYIAKYDSTSHWKECSVCGNKIDVTSHKFDNTCDTSCNDCDYTRTISHKYIAKYDSISHWKECSVCGNKIDVTSHKFDNACDTSCNDCNYIRTISHKYIAKYDSTSHWKECSVCGNKIDVTSHKFDNTCDTSCNDCDYTRTISHKYIAKYDSISHWKECSVCGNKIDVTSHKFDNACDTSCNDCNYTRTISHKYISKYDSTSHWDECSICHQVERYPHVYTVTSKNGISYYTCTDCNYSKSEITYDFNNNETLDSMDIIILKKYILNMVEQPKSLSHHFDMLDYLILKNRILESK